MNASPIARFVAVALFAAAAAATTTAWADTEGTARSRAEVKQETIAAMKAGTIVSGEAMPAERSDTASTRTRAERKAETMVARAKGELVHSGIATYRASLSQQTATAKSTKTRTERKGETLDAIKHKQTMQPGEAA
jgi:hypothetical protein